MHGKLIEYIDHGKFICAFVLAETGKRLRLLNQNGREINLAAARIIHHSTSTVPVDGVRDDLCKILKNSDKKRKHLSNSIQLEEIWELTSTENDLTFEPQFLAELCFGDEATDNHVASLLRAVFADHLFFKYKNGKIIAHTPEIVAQLQIRKAKERARQNLLNSGAQALRQLQNNEQISDWPERDLCLTLLQNYYLYGSEAAESSIARELLKKAGLTGSHDIFHLLVKAGIWHKNENTTVLQYELPVTFSQKVLTASNAAEADAHSLYADNRRDLRDLPLFTIDGESTHDYDDALHIEKRGDNYLVGIHIADVAHYVKPDTLLFKEAIKRVTSLYFPDHMIPMLPPKISEGVCSLIADKDRAAMSFMVLLTADGKIIEFEIIKSMVTVKQRLTYAEAGELIKQDDNLQILANLSQQLQQRRIDNGAVLLPIPDVNIVIDQQEAVQVNLTDVDMPARTLVAEFMLLANMIAAEYLATQQVPGLFRSQEEPHQRFVYGFEKDIFLNFKQRKQLKPGNLWTTPQFHSGVGAMQYTTVTSPIRRLVDLLMQHQLHGLLSGKGALFDEKELQDLAAVITKTQGRAGQVQRLRQRYWLLKYLVPKVGTKVQALVLNQGPRRINIVLTDCLLEGDLMPNQAVNTQPGDTVMVKIAKVNPLDSLLRLEW